MHTTSRTGWGIGAISCTSRSSTGSGQRAAAPAMACRTRGLLCRIRSFMVAYPYPSAESGTTWLSSGIRTATFSFPWKQQVKSFILIHPSVYLSRDYIHIFAIFLLYVNQFTQITQLISALRSVQKENTFPCSYLLFKHPLAILALNFRFFSFFATITTAFGRTNRERVPAV